VVQQKGIKMEELTETIKVKITDKNHPWVNKTGVVVGAFRTFVGTPMLDIALDNQAGHKCGARRDQIEILSREPK